MEYLIGFMLGMLFTTILYKYFLNEFIKKEYIEVKQWCRELHTMIKWW
jgi:uncharacterized membrane protein YdjX (TVP38/TMEM64 family)